jgi:hypothetical protein
LLPWHEVMMKMILGTVPRVKAPQGAPCELTELRFCFAHLRHEMLKKSETKKKLERAKRTQRFKILILSIT